MKFENLKTNLNKEIKPAYFIAGEDSFLVYKALELIEAALNLNFPDFNKVIYNTDGFNMTEIANSSEVLPINDKYRLIIVKDYLNKKSESEKKVITEYLKNPAKSSVLVFFASVQNDFYLSFVDKVEFVDCNKLSEPLLNKWIEAELKKENKKISKDALKTLIEFCNFSLTKIEPEVKKLAAFTGEKEQIEQTDILELVTKDTEYVIFELSEALSKKDGTACYNIVTKLLQQKETPTSILAIITGHFRRLFFSAISRFSSAELAKMLNVKEYAITKAKQQNKLFTKVALMNIYKLCLEVEYSIKSGGMEPVNAINYLIGEILNA